MSPLLLLSVMVALSAPDPVMPRLRRQPIEPEPERDPDPDPVIATRCDIGSTVMHESRGEFVRFKPDPRGADPLRRACRVCGAAGGVPCDPERLGKAGRRGAVAHRSR